MVNNFKEPDFMTRGTPYILYKKDNVLWIGYSDEFNGDMYLSGYGNSLSKRLSKVSTYEDFGFAVHEFNKTAHNYTDLEIYHKPLEEKIHHNNKFIDFNVMYFELWFSDFLFFLNLTGERFKFIDKDGKEIYSDHNDVLVFNFGKFDAVIIRDNLPIETVNP